MVVNLSPTLRQELHNLHHNDSESTSALKSYAEEMDSKDLPKFLALVSETKLIDEHTISLYEIVARAHRDALVPHISNMIRTMLETLELTDARSGNLLNGCAKLVQTLARYAIDPTAGEVKKRGVIQLLCDPLLDCLMDSGERLSDGAAFCLKALVESDNWRFASSEMSNVVCVKAASALEGKCAQLDSHMGLVMALAKRNADVVDAYARLLMKAGLRILRDGVDDGDFEKVISAIRMMNSLMKNVDPRSCFFELENVIMEMEKCQSYKSRQVNIAAYECFLTANRIVSANGSRAGSNNALTNSDEKYSTRFSRFYSSLENGSTRMSGNRRKLWRDRTGESAEFSLERSNGETRSAGNTPMLSHSRINEENVSIRSAARNLTFSLEDQMETNSKIRKKRFRKLRALSSHDQNGSCHATETESVEFQQDSEVLSSANNIVSVSEDVIPPGVTRFQKRSYRLIVWFVVAMVAGATYLFLIRSPGEKKWLVPT